jgi:hypothetical protein
MTATVPVPLGVPEVPARPVAPRRAPRRIQAGPGRRHRGGLRRGPRQPGQHRQASLFEEHDFRDIKISVKHNDPVVMIEAYRQLAESKSLSDQVG